MRETTNPDGSVLTRVYTRDSDGTAVYSDTVTENVHSQVVTHAGWSAQRHGYDALGRLTRTEDTSDTVCTLRVYGFDQRSNRTSLRTAAGTPGADCPTTGGTTTSSTYDTADRLIATGYTYDAFGRTTAAPGHGTLAYYTNDLVYRQTANGKRQTWTLDAAHRFRAWTVETGSGSTWTTSAAKRNHYDGDGDNPRWIVENTATGTVTRNVESATGDLAATTGGTGGTVLQFTNVHGDVALQLPLTAGQAPVVLDHDEYGNPRPGQEATRYGWLGAKQRSAETLTGLTLMGVRLYNPVTGRFLSPDPVHGGGDNAYGYPADPVNQYDLDGQFWSKIKKKWKTFRKKSWRKWTRRAIRVGAWVGGGVATAAICAASVGAGCLAAGFVIGAAVGSIDYQARYAFQKKRRMNRNDHVKNIWSFAIGGSSGGLAQASRWAWRGASRFFQGTGRRRR